MAMTLVLSLKDTPDKKILAGVKTFWFDYNVLNIVLSDGTLKVYPDRHVFNVEVPEYYKESI